MTDTQVKNETALTVLDGNEVLYIVYDPSGTPLDRKIEVRHIRSGLQGIVHYGMDANAYLIPPIWANTAGVLTTGRLVMSPIFVARRRTFSTYGAMVSTAVASSAIRVGLYSADQNTGQPLLKLDEATTPFDSGTTGAKTTAFAVNQQLDPGLYYIATLPSVGGISVHSSLNGAVGMGASLLSSGFFFNGGVYRNGLTYAALPSDESAQTYSTIGSLTSAFPIVGIR